MTTAFIALIGFALGYLAAKTAPVKVRFECKRDYLDPTLREIRVFPKRATDVISMGTLLTLGPKRKRRKPTIAQRYHRSLIAKRQTRVNGKFGPMPSPRRK